MRLKPRSRKTATRADQDRGTSAQRGYGGKWKRHRLAFLRQHPLCTRCNDADAMSPVPAEVVDHIVPHKGNKTLFWDRSNWQALCKACHDKKTWQENH